LPKRAWPEKGATSIRELLGCVFLRQVRFIQGKTVLARQNKLVTSVDYQLLYLDSEGQVWIDSRTLKFSSGDNQPGGSVEAQMRPLETAEELLRSRILKDVARLRNGVLDTATNHGLVFGFHSGVHSSGGSKRSGSYVRTFESISALVEQTSQTIRIEDATRLLTVRPLSLSEQKKEDAERAQLQGIVTERRNVPKYILEIIPFEPTNPWNPNDPS
jgi:hypothetical protein